MTPIASIPQFDAATRQALHLLTTAWQTLERQIHDEGIYPDHDAEIDALERVSSAMFYLRQTGRAR